jgi:hypothetical protein
VIESKSATATPLDPHSKRPRTRVSSPTPPPATLPPFLPPPEQTSDGTHKTSEAESKRAAFRKIWMSKVVEAFGGDLDHIRQVSMETSRPGRKVCADSPLRFTVERASVVHDPVRHFDRLFSSR